MKKILPELVNLSDVKHLVFFFKPFGVCVTK